MYNVDRAEEARLAAEEAERIKQEKHKGELPQWELKYKKALLNVRNSNYYTLLQDCRDLNDALNNDKLLYNNLAERANMFATLLSMLVSNGNYDLIDGQSSGDAHLIIHREMLNAGVEGYRIVISSLLKKYVNSTAKVFMMVASPFACYMLDDYKESMRYAIMLNILILSREYDISIQWKPTFEGIRDVASASRDVASADAEALFSTVYDPEEYKRASIVVNAAIRMITDRNGVELSDFLLIPEPKSMNDVLINAICGSIFNHKTLYNMKDIFAFVNTEQYGRLILANYKKTRAETFADAVAFFMSEVEFTGDQLRETIMMMNEIKSRGYRIELYHTQKFLVPDMLTKFIDSFTEMPHVFTAQSMDKFKELSWRVMFTTANSPWYQMFYHLDKAHEYVTFDDAAPASYYVTAAWDLSLHNNPVALYGMGKMISVVTNQLVPMKKSDREYHILLPWNLATFNTFNVNVVSRIAKAVKQCKKTAVFFVYPGDRAHFTQYYSLLDKWETRLPPNVTLIANVALYYKFYSTMDYVLALPGTSASVILDALHHKKHILSLVYGQYETACYDELPEADGYRMCVAPHLVEFAGIPLNKSVEELLGQFKKPQREKYIQAVAAATNINELAVAHNKKLGAAFWEFCHNVLHMEVREEPPECIDDQIKEMQEELPEME